MYKTAVCSCKYTIYQILQNTDLSDAYGRTYVNMYTYLVPLCTGSA